MERVSGDGAYKQRRRGMAPSPEQQSHPRSSAVLLACSHASSGGLAATSSSQAGEREEARATRVGIFLIYNSILHH